MPAFLAYVVYRVKRIQQKIESPVLFIKISSHTACFTALSTADYRYVHSITAGNGRSILTNVTEETTPSEEAVIPQLDEDIIPMPFDLDKELSQAKAHRQKRSVTKDKYVLYMLDSSGSIGRTDFSRMTTAMASLSLFHCPKTKIAAMSYSTNVYKNYCFNCDQNLFPRYQAIKGISYLSGSTASGDAINCACNNMLNTPCGFPSNLNGLNAPNLDVIFITDGHSNRGKDVCEAAKCWSSFSNINVFPIGIGSGVDYKELKCIRGNIVNGASRLSLRNFSDLVDFIKDIQKQAATKLISQYCY